MYPTVHTNQKQYRKHQNSTISLTVKPNRRERNNVTNLIYSTKRLNNVVKWEKLSDKNLFNPALKKNHVYFTAFFDCIKQHSHRGDFHGPALPFRDQKKG